MPPDGPFIRLLSFMALDSNCFSVSGEICKFYVDFGQHLFCLLPFASSPLTVVAFRLQ